MPTKGSQRAHEGIDLIPSSAYTPVTTTVVDEEPTPPAQPWVEDDIDQFLEDYANPADPPDDNEPTASERTEMRTYRGELTEVEMTNVTTTRERANELGAFETPVEVRLHDGTVVDGTVEVSPTGMSRYWSSRYEVNGDSRLACSCGEDPCDHRRQAVEAVGALMESRRIRSGVESWERTTLSANAALREAFNDSVRSRDNWVPPVSAGPAWSEDPQAFQQVYREARERRDQGEAPVPFMIDNATGGLGARDGGRAFGVEIEFDVGPNVDRRSALAAIGRDLHAAGITPQAQQTGYHRGRQGFRSWRFERDATVDGEIVSPILYDEPESWRKIQTVCEIVKRHGGRATARTGGHVHVGVGDYDHTVENHNNLLGMFAENEDTLYRLAQNPDRPAHRGTGWCRPNNVPASGYRAIEGDRGVRGNNGHSQGLNFGSVSGQRTDHVEFRMWDGSLDPGVIQAQVKASLGMTEAAFRTPAGTPHGAEPIGSHRRGNARLQRGQRLAGDAWRADTAGFRLFVDKIFSRSEDKAQLAALFAVTKWQRAGR